MNHTDRVPTCELEALMLDRARESAESEIYTRLHDMFGVHGENLDFYLERPTPPTDTEAAELLRDLRAEYRRRVGASATQTMEAD